MDPGKGTFTPSVCSQWKADCSQYWRWSFSKLKSSSLLLCMLLKWQTSRYLWMGKGTSFSPVGRRIRMKSIHSAGCTMLKLPFLTLEVLCVSQDSCSPKVGGTKPTSLQHTFCHQEGFLPTRAGNSLTSTISSPSWAVEALLESCSTLDAQHTIIFLSCSLLSHEIYACIDTILRDSSEEFFPPHNVALGSNYSHQLSHLFLPLRKQPASPATWTQK